MTGIGSNRLNHLSLEIVMRWNHLNRASVISSAHCKEYSVAPCQPIEQTRERAHALIERPILNTYRQVDDRHLRGHRRIVTVTLEQSADCSGIKSTTSVPSGTVSV